MNYRLCRRPRLSDPILLVKTEIAVSTIQSADLGRVIGPHRVPLTCEHCDWETRKHFRNGQDPVPIPLFRGYNAARKQLTIMRGGCLFP